ncbi:MAG: hypothetical protein ACE14P_10390 [Methanotrichaceae archaeon]
MPNEMDYQKDAMNRTVRLVSEDDMFKSMAYASLKIKAGKLKPGEIVVIGDYEFTVAEDEEGRGVTAQMIQSRKRIDSLAEAKARTAGLELNNMDDRTRSTWMAQFLGELAETLQKWQEIKMISGPGDNITFSRMVYKWSYSEWK